MNWSLIHACIHMNQDMAKTMPVEEWRSEVQLPRKHQRSWHFNIMHKQADTTVDTLVGVVLLLYHAQQQYCHANTNGLSISTSGPTGMSC
jgi:hypothetical protein